MNFKNIKIYFIVLLVAANLFLLVNLFMRGRQENKLDANTIKDTVLILSDNKIEIANGTVPSESIDPFIYECAFDNGYFERIAEKISGNERESVNILPDNSLKITLNSGESFVLDNNFCIEYMSTQSSSDILADISDIFEKTPVYTTVLQTAELSDESKSAANAFLVPDITDKQSSVFSAKVTTSYKYKDKIVAVFTQTVDGYELREHIMYLVMDNNKILCATGKWFYPEKYTSYSYDLYDQLTILFKELEYKKGAYPDNKGYAITNIESAYCLYWKTGQDGFFLVPMWKITTDEPDIRYYNAVNCSLYE